MADALTEAGSGACACAAGKQAQAMDNVNATDEMKLRRLMKRLPKDREMTKRKSPDRPRAGHPET